MSKYVISIIKDLSKFQERIDEISSETSYETVKHTVADLKRTLLDNEELVGLCAPQIGVNLRIFCVKTSDKKVKAFLNPLIVKGEGLHLSREVNPSFPNKQFIIPRKDSVHVAYQDMLGKVNSESYSGAYGEIVQQMIEMLDGILLSDYGLDLDDVGGPSVFDKATNKDKAEVLQMYLDSLKNISAEMKTEIENTPELKEISDTIDFMTKYINGEIKPLDKEGNIVEAKKENN